MKPAILFVDDNENILQGLRRNLRSRREVWDMYFAESGEAALEIMRTATPDVVVSDIRMPGIDGVELLKQVKKSSPESIRLVLSGQCEEEMIPTLLEVSHQYLAKPFETEVLVRLIEKLLAARDKLQDGGLKEFITGCAALPSLPSLHEEIVTELKRDMPEMRAVENLLLRDISLIAKIFQVVNSSYFGPNGDINTVSHVWDILGFEKIKSLILNGHIIAPLDASLRNDSTATELWQLSLLTARIARLIAKTEGLSQKICDKVWIAGLLHGIGALVLCKYRRSSGVLAGLLDPHVPDSYTVTGGFLGTLWALPRDICYVILHHASPSAAGEDGDRNVLAIVHAAQAFALTKMIPETLEEMYLDDDFLKDMGLQEKLDSWRAVSATI